MPYRFLASVLAGLAFGMGPNIWGGPLPSATTPNVTPTAEDLRAKQLSERGVRFGKTGRLNQMVECMVLSGPHGVDDPCWPRMMELLRQIAERSRKEYPEFIGLDEGSLPMRDFADHVRLTRPASFGPAPTQITERKFTSTLLVCAESISCKPGFGKSIFLSSGTLHSERPSGLGSSLIIAGDSIKAHQIVNSVVICDGDVTIERAVVRSVILARGSVICRESATNALIITEADFPFFSRARIAPTTIMKQQVTKPLGFVEFFRTDQIGLELDDPLNAVRVKKVAEGSPPALAGVKVGDVLLSVGGKDGFAIEEFRRLLRRASVQDDTVIKLRRGDKIMEVTLDFRPLHKKDEEAEAKQKETEPKK